MVNKQIKLALKARLHGQFCCSKSMQLLPRRESCKFKIALVNQLRFQRDFSTIVAATLQEFLTSSKLDAISFVAIFDKVKSQGFPREVLSSRISVCFYMVMANTDKKCAFIYVFIFVKYSGNNNKQAAATAKFMLIYRYIFRVAR